MKGQLQAESVPIKITKPAGLYLQASEKLQVVGAVGGKGGVPARGCSDTVCSPLSFSLYFPLYLDLSTAWAMAPDFCSKWLGNNGTKVMLERKQEQNLNWLLLVYPFIALQATLFLKLRMYRNQLKIVLGRGHGFCPLVPCFLDLIQFKFLIEGGTWEGSSSPYHFAILVESGSTCTILIPIWAKGKFFKKLNIAYHMTINQLCS